MSSTLEKKARRMKRTRKRFGITPSRQQSSSSSLWEELERGWRTTSHEAFKKPLVRKSLREICNENSIPILNDMDVNHQKRAYKLDFCRTQAYKKYPALFPVSRTPYLISLLFNTCVISTMTWAQWSLFQAVMGIVTIPAVVVTLGLLTMGTFSVFRINTRHVVRQQERTEAEFQRLLRFTHWETTSYDVVRAIPGYVPLEIQQRVSLLSEKTNNNTLFSVEHFYEDPFIYAEYGKEKVYIGHWN